MFLDIHQVCLLSHASSARGETVHEAPATLYLHRSEEEDFPEDRREKLESCVSIQVFQERDKDIHQAFLSPRRNPEQPAEASVSGGGADEESGGAVAGDKRLSSPALEQTKLKNFLKRDLCFLERASKGRCWAAAVRG